MDVVRLHGLHLLKHLKLVSCLLSKCPSSSSDVFSGVGLCMHWHNLHGRHSERDQRGYQNGLLPQEIKLLKELIHFI